MSDEPMVSEPTAPRASARLGTPARVVAIVVATVVVLGGALFLTSRDDRESRPRLALRTPAMNPSGADTAQAEASMRAIAGGVTIRYVVAGTLPDLPTSSPVSKIEADPIGASAVTKWATALGIDATPTDDRSGPLDAWRAVGPEGTLTVSNTGQTWFLEYHHGTATAGATPGSPGGTISPSNGASPPAPAPDTAAPPPDVRPADLPDAGTVRRLGMKTLTDLGVLDGADWTFAVHDGGTVGVASACVAAEVCSRDQESFTISRQLVATRLIDGHPVDGLDWIVDFGDHSRIENVTGTIASARRVGDYPLRSVTDAVAALNDGINGGPVPLGAGSIEPDIARAPCEPSTTCGPDCGQTDCAPREITITVTGVELARALWFGGNGNSPSEYLVPTYHFTGHDDAGQPWTSDVLALTDAALIAPPTTSTTRSPDATDPVGPSVTIGSSIPLSLDLNFHCGVSELRFNATWWDAVNPWPGSGGGSPHIADLEGTLTLDRADHAAWDNGSGVTLEFVPHRGEHRQYGCA